MAFTIRFALPKNLPLPEDPLLSKLFYDEVVKEEELCRGSSGLHTNHLLRETLLSYKNLFETIGMKRGKIFERDKNIGKLESP